MRYIYSVHFIRSHTCMPLSCEEYVHDYGYGGINITKHIGKTFKIVSELDVSSNYLGEVTKIELPDGTPEWFSYGDYLDSYKTWFGNARIKIKKSLPLGIFPIRSIDRRVSYPVRKGEYFTHIWKETAEIARRNGCEVEIFDGWGWNEMTSDNQDWAIWSYSKKLSAPNKKVEKLVKKIAVSAIGSLGRSRDVYELSTSSTAPKGQGIPVLLGNTPVDLWAIPGIDDRSAIMSHWHRYIVNTANDSVRDFAIPFAEAGSLILIDTDGVFVKGEEAGEKYIKRHSLESIGVPAGTWLWRLHHNFKVLRNRMWISDEEPERYGSLLERIV